MHIEQILAKDIDRPLDGVVKASSSAQLETEVREYVVTDEVAKHLTDLLEAYTFPGEPESNGVWIAGFFGSGKSHLLKMLAYLLGDVDGAGIARADVVQAFLAKLPAHEGILRGALERSAAIPSRSLLFNIDEKVDKNEKNQPDALLKVFVQVFYEAAGYFGKTPYIARFERDLARQGLFDRFKEAFAGIYGKPWEEGRELAVFAEPSVEKAYAEATGTTLEKPLTAYRENYTVSIESFAAEVAQWLDAQPEPRSRVGFFIDEIGQFIGQDTKLMLSLQTIAESLFVKCHGRAWVMVTSQEVMDSIIGDRTREQQQDFSKIQARFAIQLKLDSKNVREVVSKRLLEKTDDGATRLGSVYAVNEDRFRSLFSFQDQRTYKNYSTVEDFVATYPFVDYQFELFHDAMRGLSDFNAFTGRHASVGERSLLGVTKDIGSAMKGADVGALATFDMFFDGIEKSVNASVKQNVSSAARNLDGPDRDLALQVLKALLMTKYIEQFEATPQSLSVLLTPAIETNVAALHEEIERALKLLESETYVQRTGSTYAYLTNEEQDVEKAIKNHERNDSAIRKLLNEEIVNASGVGAKVRHDGTSVDLGLERWLDAERQGRSEELGVRFVTPFSGHALDDVKHQSMGHAGSVFVVLDLDQRTRDDIDLYVRTRDYVQLQMKSALPESRRRILDSHQRANVERQREVLGEIRKAVGGADLVHNGSILGIGGGPAKDRVHAALQTAIESRYTRINEARGISTLKGTDLGRILREDATLDLGVASTLDTLTNSIVVAVRNAKERQTSSTVGSLVDNFAGPPFGWSITTVLAAIAHGTKTGLVRVKLDSRLLVRTEIAEELRNPKKHPQISVEEVRAQDPAKVRKLQTFLGDYRDTGDLPSTPEELVSGVRAALAEDAVELDDWAKLPYPFGDAIVRAATTIRSATAHDEGWYLDGFLAESDDLLDLKEEVLDPIRGFLRGQQRGIVDDARAFLDRRGAEVDDVDTVEVDALRSALDGPAFFRNVPQIKQLHLRLVERLDAAVESDRVALRSLIEDRLESLLRERVFVDATDKAQERARGALRVLLDGIGAHTTRGQVALARTSFDTAYQSAIEVLINSPATEEGGVAEREQTAGEAPTDGEGTDTGTSAGAGRPKTPTKATVRLSAVTVEGAPAMLTNADQVDRYLQQLKSGLLAAIDDGKTIVL
ncbi:BREX system P-loop protein BrxC [Rhodococcus sp. BP-252]|uniref:BREX system P-loop protein BrxC n=1 Tax=unclassified Rhodococcus (in: high G+C Gram-positive bacteria) TaxID=192944 RepID=UPI001C9A8189|nr:MULTISPECIES: BREX system P-loop protein BrxC [unclassified Rhodococcus (in: high G+C Gram-positive bacteria)]MBY6414300.1 BREX system P-loop protein BrxC [Rhodococcus sp. BP-320]MBY6419047.1 BREX system P-loop protein BrxC [Rhodococcus sp. BP-321]MBY6423767.1 BREX system P-loop protein BrxC [Rhodococcus sp. BP-324]MBY6429081.1 BREX system P-loop protein BrxC [Rhodococcus sp. BP-323]MBY6434087.1 BREX system P-loop protein BrxC [Rhodococcus sp. BP-322]